MATTSALERLGIDRSETFHFVLDTNVFLDILSVHDVAPFLGLAETRLGRLARARGLIHDIAPFVEVSLPSQDVAFASYRIKRGATAAILAAAFDEQGCRTLQLRGESFEKLTAAAPPMRAPIDGVSGFPQVVGYFVLDYVWCRWRARSPNVAEKESSTACDNLLLEAARELGAPLVTNEGWGVREVRDDEKRKLRSKALAAGVRVLTTDEALDFLGVERKALAARFMKRLAAGRPRFLADRAMTRTDWRGWEPALESSEHFYEELLAMSGDHRR